MSTDSNVDPHRERSTEFLNWLNEIDRALVIGDVQRARDRVQEAIDWARHDLSEDA